MVVRSEVEDEIKVREVEMIPELREELGCYHWVFIYLNFIKDDGVYNMEEQVGVEIDPDEDDIKDVFLDDERDRHWAWFLRKTMEGWMGKMPFYMLRSRMSTIQRRRCW